ncbi:MAG: hypothetical protein ISF22_04260 [Methanomassiliicoccus sp.]|nr:hypothetical protein [Methanomassiliicoccus sp.]
MDVALPDMSLSITQALSEWFNWGIETRIEFALVTIVLAGLLLAKEIVATSDLGSERASRALTIAIIPLLALFLINLAVVFVL